MGGAGLAVVLLLALQVGAGPSPARRQDDYRREQEVRGHSFGLEHFLMTEPLDPVTESAEDIRRVPVRRKKQGERGQTYGLESFQDVHGSGSRGPVTFGGQEEEHIPEESVKNIRTQQLLLSELQRFADEGKSERRKGERMPLEKPATFQVPSETPTEEGVEEVSQPTRTRKRVMKRRKKRPSTEEPITEEQKPSTEPPQEAETVKEQAKRRKRPVGFRRLPESTTELRDYYEEPKKEDYDIVKEVEEKIDTTTTTTTTTEGPEEAPESTEESRTPQDIKALLKQQGTLSLSELLQTQNLSLADFLKGKGAAALAEKKEKEKVEERAEESRREPVKASIPRISLKSRPFSKPAGDKPVRLPPVTTEPPKTLDIEEITDDKPTYNGFTPKNPRTNRPHRLPGQRMEETTESMKSSLKVKEQESRVRHGEEESEEQSTVRSRTTTSTPSTTEENVPENKPKRYGELRQKLRIDRRKFNVSVTTERIDKEDADTSYSPVSKGPTPPPPEERQPFKSRVRVPFMSVNNPEVSVILQNKTASTERKVERPGLTMRERIKLFGKRPHAKEEVDKKDDSAENAIPERVPLDKTTTLKPFDMSDFHMNDDEEEQEIRTTTEKAKIERIERKRNHTKSYTTTESILKEKETEAPTPKPETKDEILELLKSGTHVERLERILAERNMTLEELLLNREKGSSEGNLSQEFKKPEQNQRQPKPKTEERQEKKLHEQTTSKPEQGLKIFHSFPDFTSDNRISVDPTQWTNKHVTPQDDNGFEEILGEESVVTQVRVLPDQERREQYRPPAKHEVHRVHLNLSPGDPTLRAPLPGWNVDEKSIYGSNPYGYPSYDNGRNLQTTRLNSEMGRIVEVSNQGLEENDIILLETIKKSQEANRKLKSNINEILQEQAEVKETPETEKAFIPPAVKSAIIASGVVLGIALFVFVAIFAACGWKQRQIRLKARSSILNDTLTRNISDKKGIKRSNTMSPISFKQTSLYKKSLDFDETASQTSGSSNTSSYLWNTLKNTFTSRNNTLKNRLEKEEKEREEQILRNTLKRERERDEMLRNTLKREERLSTLQRQERHEERFSSLKEERGLRKIDPERNVVKTSLTFKRGGMNGSTRFSSCGHLN